MVDKSVGRTVFKIVNAILFIIYSAICLLPILHVLAVSLSSSNAARSGEVAIWPVEFTLKSYEYIMKNEKFWNALIVSFKRILFGVTMSMIITILAAYPLSKPPRDFRGRSYLIWIYVFTMFFSGGMIPSYLNIRSLGLFNSLWALILPSAMSVYNAIICKTAIEAVPDSLIESAYIDGANDIFIIFRIVFPLIMSTVAVLLLYYGVGHWNSWFPASLYIQENDKLPIQNVLRAVLIANSNILNSAATDSDKIDQFAETIKYAAIVISTVPVLMIYPFLQKYFVKGVMIGAVKG